MARNSTSYFSPPSTHPSRYPNPHHPIELVASLCGNLTAAQLLVQSRAAADAARSATERAGVAAALGRQLDNLLARIEHSPEAVLYARAFELLDMGANRHAAAVGVNPDMLAALAALSDLLLDLCTPCRADARPRRRRGIVRRGDGYPLVQPHAPHPARVYHLIDERDTVIVPCTEYEVLDWAGDPHTMVAPVGDRGDGRISRDTLRAFLALGLANLYRKCEVLTDRDRRGRYADWPYPTRMPGLIAAGSKEEIVVDVVELLRVHCFGPPPSAAIDVDEPSAPAMPSLPALPRAASLLLPNVGEEALDIEELPPPPLRARWIGEVRR